MRDKTMHSVALSLALSQAHTHTLSCSGPSVNSIVMRVCVSRAPPNPRARSGAQLGQTYKCLCMRDWKKSRARCCNISGRELVG